MGRARGQHRLLGAVALCLLFLLPIRYWYSLEKTSSRLQALLPPWDSTAAQRAQMRQFFSRINPGVNYDDPESTHGGALCEEIIYTGDWPICGDALTNRSGLVYGFGIHENWDFEAAAGARGFEVHAFDPTTPYGTQLDTNVTFRCWGLSGDEEKVKGSNPRDNEYMGNMLGPVASLENIVQVLGHSGRDIQILKIDCEGCEWTALDFIARSHPALLGRVRQLNIEMHFATYLGVNSSADMDKVLAAVQLLDWHGFRPWYSFPNPASSTQWHLTQLANLGLDLSTCCYEMAFIRYDRQALKRTPVVPLAVGQAAMYEFPQGKLWHTGGVEFVPEGLFRSWTVYQSEHMALRAADARGNATSCTQTEVTRASARRPVELKTPVDRTAAHWQKRAGFADAPRPLPIRMHSFAA